MALTRFLGDTGIISDLPDQPNDTLGMSPADLKAKFDQIGVEIVSYLNEVLIPELERDIDAAAAGISSGGLSGQVINNRTITSNKLANTAGDQAVQTDVIKDKAVTKAKLEQSLQNTIDSLKTVASTGSYNDLTDKPVIDSTLSVLSDNAVENGVVTAELNTKQKQHTEQTVTLASGQTSWTVSCPGVTADNLVIARADPQYAETEMRCFIRCTGQGSGTLTFTASSAPSTSVTMNVAIFD